MAKSYYSSYYGEDEDEMDDFDSYRGSTTYGKNKKKETYTYGGYSSNHRKSNGWSNWGNWSSYSTYDSRDLEDSKLVVESPEGYLTPTKKEMSYKNVITQNYGNYSQYGYNAYDIKEDSSKFIKNISRFFYHDMMENEEFFGKIPTDNSERIKYEQIIDKIKDIRLPFTSPLEKAVFFHNKIFKGKEDKENFGDVIMSDRLQTVLEQMKVDEDSLNDKDLTETLDDIMKPGGLMGGDPFNNNTKGGHKINPHNIDKYELLDKISLIKCWGEAFKISKEVKKEVIHNSDIKEYMQMTSIEQIIHMDLYNILFPNFKYKLATSSLHVNLPIKKDEKKQKIIMLIDDSGSMNAKEKIEWVLALLADRLKQCKKGEAELFVSKFESHETQSRFKFYHIFDRKSYNSFIEEFDYNPCGGDTQIGRHVNYIHSEITNYKRLHNLKVDLSKEKVEILILNDGQDSCKTQNFPWKSNAISLFGMNSELKSLCLQNKGKYIYVGGNDAKDIKEFGE